MASQLVKHNEYVFVRIQLVYIFDHMRQQRLIKAAFLITKFWILGSFNREIGDTVSLFLAVAVIVKPCNLHACFGNNIKSVFGVTSVSVVI